METRDLALRQSADALLTGVYDPAAFSYWVNGDNDQAMRLGAFLREHRISVFADKRANLVHRPVALAGAMIDGAACIGSIDVVASEPNFGIDALRTTGRAWDLRRNAAVSRVFIVDDAGLVAGYASGALESADRAEWRGYATVPSQGKLRAFAWLGHGKICPLGARRAPRPISIERSPNLRVNDRAASPACA